MKVIGVTGGIGSGKSTVSRILYDLGAKLVDADMISRKIAKKGEDAYNELVEYFGEDILNEKGMLDRKKLGEIIFNDRAKREVVNGIMHKYVAREIYKKLDLYDENDVEFAVVDAPIPVKFGFLDVVDEVWVITADRETRIQRLIKRDKLSREEILERMNAQLSDEEYLSLADEVIINNGNVQELEKTVARLFVQKKAR